MPIEPTSPTLVRAAPPANRTRRRVRHQMVDAATVAGVSLAGSIVVVATIWVVTTWLI